MGGGPGFIIGTSSGSRRKSEVLNVKGQNTELELGNHVIHVGWMEPSRQDQMASCMEGRLSRAGLGASQQNFGKWKATYRDKTMSSEGILPGLDV